MSRIRTLYGQPQVYNATPPTLGDLEPGAFQADVNGNTKVTAATYGAGEDLVNNRLLIEQRYSNSGVLTSDTTVKTGTGYVAGFVLSCADAAPTAGTIDLYDGTSAAGTKIGTAAFTTTWFAPVYVPVWTEVATGIFVDFTTTADVNAVVYYR